MANYFILLAGEAGGAVGAPGARQRSVVGMRESIHLLLDLGEEARWAEIEEKFSRVIDFLKSQEATGNRKARQARADLVRGFKCMSSYMAPDNSSSQKVAEKDGRVEEAAFCRPKLGQILMAAGLLTMTELDSVLEIQKNTATDHIPIGELLVALGYLTVEQKDYYLRQQDFIRLPSDHPDRWGRRLVALGLVNEDQLKVALIDQKTTGCTLREALINRGWLTSTQLDRIF